MKEHYIQSLIQRRKNGESVGICSVCSANPFVLRATMRQSKKYGVPALIEATANQVNQYGGYTGMRPADFVAFVRDIANIEGFPFDQVILGGDHLGPLIWSGLQEEEAMKHAALLVDSYVRAGFSKIHLDTTMRLRSDNIHTPLSDDIIAARAARLAAVVQEAVQESPGAAKGLVLVIGSEVPVPGGTQSEDETMRITDPSHLRNTIEAFRRAFEEADASAMWRCVTAIVTQPGVEFGDFGIHPYNRAEAAPLMKAVADFPWLVLEGHSTDYQPREKLKEMTEDGVAILKVGPALTFFLREALFALDRMEQALPAGKEERAFFEETLERVMLENPGQWEKYYIGTEEEKSFKRKYSLSDRARYYLAVPAVDEAVHRLIENLQKREVPFSLLSQFMPVQAKLMQNERLSKNPEDWIISHISGCLEDYSYATLPDKVNTKGAINE